MLNFDELRRNIKGEILLDEASLNHYKNDASIFEMRPQAILLPRDKEDLFLTINWVKKQKERGEKISITPRGKGTDLTGGAINEGIIVRFSGYLDKILEIGDDFVRVEPGIILGVLQKELLKTGKWIPINPASADFASVGGVVANNAGGTKAVKYGTTKKWVRALKVILADGKEIEVKKLNKNDLAAKFSQNDLEGSIYKQIKELIEKNREIINSNKPNATKISSGYDLWNVFDGDNFSLIPLFSPSQGTLGLITEITFEIRQKPFEEGLVLGYFDDLQKASEAVLALLKLQPSALEMVDEHIEKIIRKINPELTKDLPEKLPKIILYAEFEGQSRDEVLDYLIKAHDVMKNYAYDTNQALEPPKENELWKLRTSAAHVINQMEGDIRAVPLEFDAAVAPEFLPRYLTELEEIFEKYNFTFSVWGHAGDGNLHIRPIINTKSEDDFKKLALLSHDVYSLVAFLKGVASGEHGDGIQCAPFLDIFYSEEMLKLFRKVKEIFDAQSVFNPDKKINVSLERWNAFLRKNLENYGKINK